MMMINQLLFGLGITTTPSIFLLIGLLCIFFINPRNIEKIKKISLLFSFIPMIHFLIVWGVFKKSVGLMQFASSSYWIPGLNLSFATGIDGISLFFVLLTTLLVPLCLLLSWTSIKTNVRSFYALFLIIELFLVNAFCVLDVLMFYIFFESILIPMFLIIGVWGSRERKVLASYYFFLYTLFGSVFMLVSIIYLYYQVGTTDYETLLSFKFSITEQKFLWFAFFLAFAAKVPLMPLHLWLPEAHVEAPTAGSVLLAGILLKLGTYGLIRFSLPLFPEASFYFTPLVYTISVISIVYASCTAVRQTDFKRVIAYTSVAHMNVVVMGIFSFTVIGLEGAILQSLSHGFVASALFSIIGVVYERYGTRLIKYYGGLAHVMPLYTSIFLFFTVANIGFPGTSGFVGEFLLLAGSFNVNTVVAFIGASGMVLGGCYALWLFNRIAFGNIKNQFLKKFSDINKREAVVFSPLIFYTVVLGIFPNSCLSSVHASVNSLVEHLYF